jgi:hypothetical protein
VQLSQRQYMYSLYRFPGAIPEVVQSVLKVSDVAGRPSFIDRIKPINSMHCPINWLIYPNELELTVTIEFTH